MEGAWLRTQATSVLSALQHTWPTPLEELQFVWWHMSQQHFWVQAYSSNDVAVLGFFSKEAEDSLAEVFAFNRGLFTAPLDLCRGGTT
jgi:hypothetical protein